VQTSILTSAILSNGTIAEVLMVLAPIVIQNRTLMPVIEHNALNRLFLQNDCYSEGKSYLLIPQNGFWLPRGPIPESICGIFANQGFNSAILLLRLNQSMASEVEGVKRFILIRQRNESVRRRGLGCRAPMASFLICDAVECRDAEKILGRAPIFILNRDTYATSNSKRV
jgi:hypothetical protein